MERQLCGPSGKNSGILSILKQVPEVGSLALVTWGTSKEQVDSALMRVRGLFGERSYLENSSAHYGIIKMHFSKPLATI